MRVWRVWIYAGWILYAASWVMPAYYDHDSGGVPGWTAFMMSVIYGTPLHRTIAMTNVIMLGTLGVFRMKRERITRILLPLMLASTGLNGLWFLLSLETHNSLSVGYYSWWGSFAIVTWDLVQFWRNPGARRSDVKRPERLTPSPPGARRA